MTGAKPDRRRAIVVDDALLARRMIGDALRYFGFEVVGEAGNGKEAVKICDEMKPGLVTLDWNMPGPSGVDTLRGIFRAAPMAVVIVITALKGKLVERDAIAAGASAVLSKPFRREDIEAALEKLGLELPARVD